MLQMEIGYTKRSVKILKLFFGRGSHTKFGEIFGRHNLVKRSAQVPELGNYVLVYDPSLGSGRRVRTEPRSDVEGPNGP